MADAKVTSLSALTAITADDLLYVVDDPAGTPASKKAAASVMQAFVLNALGGGSEIAVTGATTATINRMHLCTGTSADYTLTLPAASGNGGSFIGVRMGTTSTLTKLVTIDGNASETIDGSTTRIMWSDEAAILLCDGSNWFKVAGKTIPLTVMIKRTTDQSFSASTWTACTFTAKHAGSDFMWDSGNGRVKIARPSNYAGHLITYMTFTGSGASSYCTPVVTATTPPGSSQQLVSTSDAQFGCGMGVQSLTTSDYVNGSVYATGTSPSIKGSVNATYLSVFEVPTW